MSMRMLLKGTQEINTTLLYLRQQPIDIVGNGKLNLNVRTIKRIVKSLNTVLNIF